VMGTTIDAPITVVFDAEHAKWAKIQLGAEPEP
jgi:hypothetical protein